MEVQEFSDIKNKINRANIEAARAEGAMGKIKSQVKEEYNLGVDDIPNRIEELEGKINSDNKKADKHMADLQEVTDWDAI